jgi:hypothetical protein
LPKVRPAILLWSFLISGCTSSAPSPSPAPSGLLATASSSPESSNGSAPEPTFTVQTPSPHPTVALASAAPTVAARLPVKGSGRDLGTEIRMTPGPDGRLWISIPGQDGPILGLLDNAGKPSPGWPILLPGVERCDQLLDVADASVRVVCDVRPAIGAPQRAIARVFALDANARSMPGWPVDVEDGSIGRMDGDELTMLVNPILQIGGEAGKQWPVATVRIAADGTRRTGPEVSFPCCDSAWFIGPDGIAYGLTRRNWTTTGSTKTDILAFGLDGRRPGWPVTIDGNVSDLAFDARGHVYTVVEAPDGRTSRTVVLDQDGRGLEAGSDGQAITSSATWNGAGDSFPAPPVVADDGTTFIISTENGRTTVLGLNPAGQPLAGWPYRSTLRVEWTGFCGNQDTGCGQNRTAPAVDSNDVLYLLNAATGSSTGDSMVAIGADGRVRDGWPVGLRRAGSMFWSMAVAPYGLAWALAIEPEKHGYSATVLQIADDSRVLSTTTVVEP